MRKKNKNMLRWFDSYWKYFFILGMGGMILGWTACYTKVPAAFEKKSETKSIPHTSLFQGFRVLGDETIMTDTAKWGELNTHDPTVIKEKDIYYSFSTDASLGDFHDLGIQIRKSSDLITWEYVGTAFSDFSQDCAEVIRYAKLDVVKKQGLWAPEVLKVGGKFWLYFSASTFGSSRSCIGLAESNTVEGPYTYKGMVVQSEVNAVTGANAIDPAIIRDTGGNIFLSYGSFSGGIFITELDNTTGFVKDPTQKPIRIAGSPGASIEASSIVYVAERDFYYLFVSYGSLSSNYNIRVGRSPTITGPYLDANGMDMTLLGSGNEERVGTKLIGGYRFITDMPKSKGYMAPGHSSILLDKDDKFIIHHARTYTLPEYWFYMNVRRWEINRFGWPVLLPYRYYGETWQPLSLSDGEYNFIQHLSDSNSISHDSVKIQLEKGQITGAITGSYKIYQDYRLEIQIDGKIYDGYVAKQFDGERQKDMIVFTAMSRDGLCVWGAKEI